MLLLPDQVLPLGASKGSGVAWLLNHMAVPASEVMAMGDGENDLEMLQLAAWGVAMGNAGTQLQAVADAVVASNDEMGVAQAIQRFVLEPRQARVG
jgi:hydroxymethylpyrimidine pyrophosphatase-like HAD family hydrolase